MKYVVLCLFAVVAIACARPDDKYTTKYDGIDIDEVLKSDRLFKNYFNCLMDRGRCTPDGTELKRYLPDALQTNCSKCSEKQKNGSDKVIKYMIEHRKPQWEELQEKFDPDHTYVEKYRDYAKTRGVEI